MSGVQQIKLRPTGVLLLALGFLLSSAGALGLLLCFLALAFSFTVPPGGAVGLGVVCAATALFGWRTVACARVGSEP